MILLSKKTIVVTVKVTKKIIFLGIDNWEITLVAFLRDKYN